jgi:hypothetical protein
VSADDLAASDVAPCVELCGKAAVSLARQLFVPPRTYRDLLGDMADGAGRKGPAVDLARRQYARAATKSMDQVCTPAALSLKLLTLQALRATAAAAAGPPPPPSLNTPVDVLPPVAPAAALDCLAELALPSGLADRNLQQLLDGEDAWHVARQLQLHGGWSPRVNGDGRGGTTASPAVLQLLEAAMALHGHTTAFPDSPRGAEGQAIKAQLAAFPEPLKPDLPRIQTVLALFALADDTLAAHLIRQYHFNKNAEYLAAIVDCRLAHPPGGPDWLRLHAPAAAAAQRLLLQAGWVVDPPAQGAWCALAAAYKLQVLVTMTDMEAAACVVAGGQKVKVTAPTSDLT